MLMVRTHLARDAALARTLASLREMDSVRSVIGVLRVEGETS